MLKIIKGRKYDSSTAQELGVFSYSQPGDFNHYTEVLYRKRTGEYFLHGWGGAMSPYSEKAGQNEWSGGERIRPLTFEQAQEWAEKKLSGEEYEKIFGEVEENGEKQVVSMSLDMETVEKLKRISVEKRISVSELVCQLVAKL